MGIIGRLGRSRSHSRSATVRPLISVVSVLERRHPRNSSLSPSHSPPIFVSVLVPPQLNTMRYAQTLAAKKPRSKLFSKRRKDGEAIPKASEWKTWKRMQYCSGKSTPPVLSCFHLID